MSGISGTTHEPGRDQLAQDQGSQGLAGAGELHAAVIEQSADPVAATEPGLEVTPVHLEAALVRQIRSVRASTA